MTPAGTRDLPLPTPAVLSGTSAAPDQKISGSNSKRPANVGGEGDAVGAMQAVGAASGMKKGPWTAAEDAILLGYVREHGEGNWNAVQRNTRLSRCGKSCRLRWANHLRPNLKKGAFSPDEERLVLQLHAQMGNKWARMAALLPGRTDNEIKNYWNTRLKRRLRADLPLYPPDIQQQLAALIPCSEPTPPLDVIYDLNAQFSAPVGNSPLNLFDRISFNSGTGPSWAVRNPHILISHSQPPFTVPPPPTSASQLHHRVDVNKRLRGSYDDASFSLPLNNNTNPAPRGKLLSAKASLIFQCNGTLQGPSPPSLSDHPQRLTSFYGETELPSCQLLPAGYSSTVAAGSGTGVVGRQSPDQQPNIDPLFDVLLCCHPRQPACSGNRGWGGNVGDRGHHLQGESLMPALVSHDHVKWVEATMRDHSFAAAAAAAAAVEPMSGIMRWEPASGCGGTNLPLAAETSLVKRSGPAQKMKMAGSSNMEGDFSALVVLQDMIAAPMANMDPTAAAPTAAAAAAPGEWLASGDSWEGSHGQSSSSAVTDDVDHLDVLQLASSVSMALQQEDHISCCAGPCQFCRDGKPAGFH